MHKSLAIALVSGFALLSCAKPERQAGDRTPLPPDSGMDYITAVGPGAQVKTLTQDGVKVLWTDGDKIGMYGNAEYTTRLQEPSAQATFGRTSDAKPEQAGGAYLAVYPASAVAQWGAAADLENPDSPFCYVTVPTQQTAVKGSWDKKAAILAASSQTKDFAFRHAVSYLRFEVTDQTDAFVSVRLSSTNKEKLSGTQTALRFLSPEQLTATPGSSAADYVILRNADNGAFQEGAYYMTFLPGDLAGGLSLTFTNGSGLVAEKTIGALTLKQGDVVDYGPVTALEFAAVTVPLEKATVYMENGVNQGVVYWINPDDSSQGKIVSVASEEMLWSDGLLWTTKIESTTDGLANYAQFNASTVYTENKDKFYALKYCEDLKANLGGNWYLPAPGELQTLYNAYYGLSKSSLSHGIDYRYENGVLIQSAMDTKRGFDAALSLLGETATATLDGDADADGVCDNAGFGSANGVSYWTSKLNTGGPAQYVSFGVYGLANNKDKYTSLKCYVRCIRDVK